MKDLIGLIQKIVKQTIKDNVKPVTVQTGIMKNSTEVNLDQAFAVKPTVPKIFEDGIEVHIEGTINGGAVTGDLVLTRVLKEGDKVKVIKEDGTSKYYITDQLTP